MIEKERDVKDLQSKLDHEIELRKEAQTSAERSDAMTKELMKELEVSRDAEHQLKLQKLENQHLQHTIENVNREYEQLQIQLEPGSQNGGHSGPVTLTRNSGVAISKELLSASGEFEPIRERLIETVVTRTIKVNQGSWNRLTSRSAHHHQQGRPRLRPSNLKHSIPTLARRPTRSLFTQSASTAAHRVWRHK